MTGYLLRIILSFDPATVTITAEVWKLPNASIGGPAIFIGSSKLGPTQPSPRDLTLRVYNDRPFFRIRSLDASGCAVGIYKTAIRGNRYY